MPPTISVVVTVYNRFELTKRAVESVLAQALPVSEVLLIDDGSFDGTSELLQRHIAASPSWRGRVHYYHQENQGPGAARNNAIAQARGEWLAFIDNDDLWLPQKLEWQFRALSKFSESEVCFTDAWFMNNPRMKMTLFQLAAKTHNEPIGIINDPLRYILQRGPLQGIHPVWVPTLVTRTDLARRIGAFDSALRIGEDDDFVFRLACETKFCYVSMPMAMFDRPPVTERHTGASSEWDDTKFRLRMTQLRFEKRIRLGGQLPAAVRKAVRADLAAVHSGWANWFLENGRYASASAAISEAGKWHLTPGIAMKRVLISVLPDIARQAVMTRRRLRERKTVGLG